MTIGFSLFELSSPVNWSLLCLCFAIRPHWRIGETILELPYFLSLCRSRLCMNKIDNKGFLLPVRDAPIAGLCR